MLVGASARSRRWGGVARYASTRRTWEARLAWGAAAILGSGRRHDTRIGLRCAAERSCDRARLMWQIVTAAPALPSPIVVLTVPTCGKSWYYLATFRTGPLLPSGTGVACDGLTAPRWVARVPKCIKTYLSCPSVDVVTRLPVGEAGCTSRCRGSGAVGAGWIRIVRSRWLCSGWRRATAGACGPRPCRPCGRSTGSPARSGACWVPTSRSSP